MYHIMLRGINQQVIFEDDEDYFKFIETSENYKAVSGYKVFAYCLMSDHIHILIKAEKEDSCFLTALEHIHQNPVKAGIVKSIDDYRFSSYNDYIDEENDIVDCDFAFSLLRKDEFIAFSNENNDDICLDIDPKEFRINDNDARKIIKKVSKCDNSTQFQELPQKNEINL